MRLLAPVLVTIACLCGCGGGDGVLTNSAALGANIVTVQASVWHAPGTVVDPSNPDDCPDLYAGGEFTAAPGPFPADVAVPLVEVYRDGALLWTGAVRDDAGLLRNGNLHAVAAACGLKLLPPEGTPLTLRFVLTGGGAMTSLVTAPLPLQFAY
jgi:hypothetical protein